MIEFIGFLFVDFTVMMLKFREIYYADLIKKKLLPKRGISLDKAEETLPVFHQRLLATSWICFATETCKANDQCVREFYAKLMDTIMASIMITIRGKVVDYRPEAINRLQSYAKQDYSMGRHKGRNIMLDDVLINIVYLIVDEFLEFKMHGIISLVVPLLITEICKWAEVEQEKKDSGKSVHVEDDPPRTPVMGPFESLASELRVVKEKKKAQLANFEKVYASLALSHGELSISHGQMKKREKSRDKFFTQMWKRVKDLWKVLKENEPLRTSRPDEDGYESIVWSDDGGDKDSEATKTNGED
ncbi:hypothetical protein H5410_002631 [Solanum commersonii]|uniref:Uncharacterized protein n=1 Tax=Solanum commersonii TaxID=4109 RepID=A0A9J6B2U4_SOLCO|nr:hypothetical protein H5410_002631 [Solanum commersonii]